MQAAIIVVYYCGLASLLIRHDKMISPDVIGGDAITSSSYPVQLHNLTTRQIMIQFFPISALMQVNVIEKDIVHIEMCSFYVKLYITLVYNMYSFSSSTRGWRLVEWLSLRSANTNPISV